MWFAMAILSTSMAAASPECALNSPDNCYGGAYTRIHTEKNSTFEQLGVAIDVSPNGIHVNCPSFNDMTSDCPLVQFNKSAHRWCVAPDDFSRECKEILPTCVAGQKNSLWLVGSQVGNPKIATKIAGCVHTAGDKLVFEQGTGILLGTSAASYKPELGHPRLEVSAVSRSSGTRGYVMSEVEAGGGAIGTLTRMREDCIAVRAGTCKDHPESAECRPLNPAKQGQADLSVHQRYASEHCMGTVISDAVGAPESRTRASGASGGERTDVH